MDTGDFRLPVPENPSGCVRIMLVKRRSWASGRSIHAPEYAPPNINAAEIKATVEW